MAGASMPHRKPPLAARVSESAYRALLWLAYPAGFRRLYGRDMLEMFRDRCADTVRTGGWRALARLWGATLTDLARHGGAERSARRGGAGRGGVAGLGTDLVLALRSLRSTPGFTAVALLTLALGIGANTAVFSVIDSALLASLPFPQADQLVTLWRYDAPSARDSSFAYPDISDIGAETETFAALSPYEDRSVVVARSTEGQRVGAANVAPSFFDVLGIPPASGRPLQPGEPTWCAW